MQKKICLTIITENQNGKIKAEKLSNYIQNCNEGIELISIDKYIKNKNSFQLEFEILIDSEKNNFINEILSKANKIVMPWLIYCYENNTNFELIFKKDELSRFRKDEFNVIKWMQICVE